MVAIALWGAGRGWRRQGDGTGSFRHQAFAKAAATMDRVDLWHARLALKRLRKDQREAIAEAVEA